MNAGILRQLVFPALERGAPGEETVDDKCQEVIEYGQRIITAGMGETVISLAKGCISLGTGIVPSLSIF